MRGHDEGLLPVPVRGDFRAYGKVYRHLSPEQQADFIRELPDVFLPVAGGWGKSGATHIRLAAATEDVLTGALEAAWRLRIKKNAAARRK